MKNIVIISYINPSAVRGLQIVAINLAKALQNSGFNVSIFSRGNEIESYSVDGIRVNTYKYYKKNNYLLDKLNERTECIKAWKYHYKNINIDVVNGHDYLPYIFVNSILTKHVKKIFTVHDPLVYHQKMLGNIDNKMSLKRSIFTYIEKKVEKISDITYVISNYTNNRMIVRRPIDNKNRKLVFDWIDTEKFILPDDKEKIREKFGFEKGEFIVYTLRALEKRMGLDNLIKAFDSFSKTHPNSRLVIGGKGPMAKDLKDLADSLNNNKIVFLGYVPDEKVVEYYQAADLFVLPSIDGEGFGLPIIEAMACGTPVLATPVCAIPEVLYGKKERILEGIQSKDILIGLKKIYNKEVLSYSERKYVVDNFSCDRIFPLIMEDLR